MLPTMMKKAIRKSPLAFKIVFLLLIVYTLYSIKVDVETYIGDTDIGIAVEEFHFERSLCNPVVLKEILNKLNQTHAISVESTTKKHIEQSSTLLPWIYRHTRSPTYFETPAEVVTSLKDVNIIESASQKSNKLRANVRQSFKTENVIIAKQKAQRRPNDVPGRNGPRDARGQPRRQYDPPFHRETAERSRQDAQRKKILNAQAQSARTNDLSADDESDNSKTVLTDTTAPTTLWAIVNKTTAPPPRKPATVSQRGRKVVPSNGRERGKISTSRVVHAVPRPDYVSSPYYLDTIHPLHIDLAKFVREKIERGLEIPVDPVNVKKIEYIYKPADCKFESSIYNFSLLVIVISNARHLDMRSMIRDTWGSGSMYTNVKVVFAVGSELRAVTDVREESKLYGDILQGNFIDNSFNMTHKTTMAFTWTTENCPDADVILLAEEDHLVQIKHILKYISTFDRSEVKNMFAGFVINYAEVERTRNSRWSVRWLDFPHKFWPPYLRKGCMVVSGEVTKQLAEAFPYVKYLHVYDAYLGIVAKKLSLVLQNDVRFFQTGSNLLRSRDYFVFDGFNTPKVLNEAWHTLTNSQN